MKRIHYHDGKQNMPCGSGPSLPGWYVWGTIRNPGGGFAWQREPEGPFDSPDAARAAVPTAFHRGYLIQISEVQRACLEALFIDAGMDDGLESGHPLEYWVDMLQELPAQEPDIINGFCL